MKLAMWKRNLILLWFSQLIVMSGFSAMIPFIPLFIKNKYGITSDGEIAFYVAFFNFLGTLAYAVFCPIWGVLADRFGVKPMLLRGTFATGWMFPVMAYVPTPGWLLLLRFFSAACAGTTAASQVMIARNTPDDKQGFALGVLTTAIWGGAMLGNVIGGLLIHYFNYTTAFWVCGILYMVSGISVLFTREEAVSVQMKNKLHSVHVKSPVPFIPVFTRAVWIMLLLFLLMGIIRNFESPYVALKIEEIAGAGTAAYWTGIVSAVACVGAILSGVVNGYLSDRLPPLKQLLPLLILSATALVLQGCSGNLWLFTLSRTLLFISAGALPTILQKQLSAVTPKRKRGSVFGFSSAALYAGGMIASLAGGWSMSLFQCSGVFYTAAVLFTVSIFFFSKGLKAVLAMPRHHQ